MNASKTLTKFGSNAHDPSLVFGILSCCVLVVDLLSGVAVMKRRMSEVEKRDRQLDMFELTRAELLDVAKEAAVKLANAHGTVTSPAVVKELRRCGWGQSLDRVDLRFMGAVFRRGWKRVGWALGASSPGSHARPVAIWSLK